MDFALMKVRAINAQEGGKMKLCKVLIIALAVSFLITATAFADDFSWTRNFNIQAKADPSGFKSKFAERFNLTDLQVAALLTIFETPADAYIMLRFGEMQGVLKKLTKEQGVVAVKKYRHNREKGWSVMAEILGVDSGSRDFHALKRGHDLLEGNSASPVLYSASYKDKNTRSGFKN
jgi:hypothetical protein